MNWVIVIAENVIGKSRGPKGFKRFKPYHYSDSWKPHAIVYASSFEGTEAEALEWAESIGDEMLMIYTIGMGKTDTYCVRDYTLVLHNVEHDQPKNIASTIEGDESEQKGYLYDRATCSNRLLRAWGIL